MNMSMNKEQQILHMMGALYMRIKEENISKEELQVFLLNMESIFLELSEKYHYDPNHLDKQFQALNEQMNEKLRLLEEKVQKSNPLLFVQEQTGKICDEIKAFWRDAGFHFIKEIGVNASGVVEVDFGFSFDYGLSFSQNKISKKEEIQKTKERLLMEGYLFNEKGTDLLACDSNIEKLEQLIIGRFPSAIVYSYETVFRDLKQHIIRNINVRIRNINDVFRTAKEMVK